LNVVGNVDIAISGNILYVSYTDLLVIDRNVMNPMLIERIEMPKTNIWK
jgi:hypothetical protein